MELKLKPEHKIEFYNHQIIDSEKSFLEIYPSSDGTTNNVLNIDITEDGKDAFVAMAFTKSEVLYFVGMLNAFINEPK